MRITTKGLDNPEVRSIEGEGKGSGTSNPLQGHALPCCALLLQLCLQTHFIPECCKYSGQVQLLNANPSLSCVWKAFGYKPLTCSDRQLKHPIPKWCVQGPHIHQLASQE